MTAREGGAAARRRVAPGLAYKRRRAARRAGRRRRGGRGGVYRFARKNSQEGGKTRRSLGFPSCLPVFLFKCLFTSMHSPERAKPPPRPASPTPRRRA